jgi:hypothetical protein
MAILRVLASWLLGIANHFPARVQPGVYIALIILLLWIVVRALRPLWNALIRLLCLAVDFGVGLVLLPEFVWTRAQRARGCWPGPLTLASGRVAEYVLDVAADVYEMHPFRRISKRPPLVLIALLLIASGVDYWLLHKSPPGTASRYAADTWRYWVQFRNWTDGK